MPTSLHSVRLPNAGDRPSSRRSSPYRFTEELLSGIHQFHAQVFKREKDFYSKLVAGQSSSTLFIGCSDSRVDPTIITQSDLGELFVLRNAGNIVPCYGASNGGEPATIEYAVSALGVRDIVICGCGELNLHAWVYLIESGDILAYSTEDGRFASLTGLAPQEATKRGGANVRKARK